MEDRNKFDDKVINGINGNEKVDLKEETQMSVETELSLKREDLLFVLNWINLGKITKEMNYHNLQVKVLEKQKIETKKKIIDECTLRGKYFPKPYGELFKTIELITYGIKNANPADIEFFAYVLKVSTARWIELLEQKGVDFCKIACKFLEDGYLEFFFTTKEGFDKIKNNQEIVDLVALKLVEDDNENFVQQIGYSRYFIHASIPCFKKCISNIGKFSTFRKIVEERRDYDDELIEICIEKAKFFGYLDDINNVDIILSNLKMLKDIKKERLNIFKRILNFFKMV